MTEPSGTLRIPAPQRPVTQKEYGIPDDPQGMLDWPWVRERMQAARSYWIATTAADGRPHTRPAWGAWVDDVLYFGGGPETYWSRNLDRDPRVSVHTESADEVVIIEGTVDRVDVADTALLERIDDVYERKYGMRHGPPFWRLHPRKVFAWGEFPTTPTKWDFGRDKHGR